MKRRSMGLLGAVLMVWAAPAAGQSRPLVTEDPETVPAGFILLETGFDFAKDARFPVAGLEGTLWRVGTFGLSFGVSSIAEIQIDGGVWDSLSISTFDPSAPHFGELDLTGESTGGLADLRVGAKIRLASETASRPAFAVQFSTRLPLAGVESGLGGGAMDFLFGVGIAKTVQSVRVAGNGGFALLGDPITGHERSSAVTYGFSVARAVAQGVEVVGEMNGRFDLGSGVPQIGAEDRSVVRVGSRFTRGPVRLDGAMLFGVTEQDPTWGLSAGLTWVFRAFTVQ